MHPYRRHILHELALSSGARRFSELKPEGTESNVFIYHLKKLVAEGFIKKLERGYCLAAAGKRYVEKLSMASFEPRLQPKIVTLVICKDAQGRHLLYTRKRQPFYALVGFPYGKVHFGETVAEAAVRELREKTGLSARLVHRGEVYLVIRANGELISHMLCHVFTGTRPAGRLITESETGSCEWKDIRTIARSRFIPGFLQIFALARKSTKPFFKELSIGD